MPSNASLSIREHLPSTVDYLHSTLDIDKAIIREYLESEPDIVQVPNTSTYRVVHEQPEGHAKANLGKGTAANEPKAHDKAAALWKAGATVDHIHQTLSEMLGDESQVESVIADILPVNVINAETLVATEYPPPRFAIPNLVPDGLTIMAGPPKIGKSFLALDMGVASAMGGRVASDFIVPDPRSVLYLALEDYPARLQTRINMITTSDSQFPSLLNVIPSGGFDYKLDTQGISLLDHIASQHKAEFVIIDTLQEVKPQSKKGGTAYDIDGEVLGNIQKWATQKRIAVLMVTHLRKAIDPDNPFNDIQGSVGVQAKADCLILLREFEGVYTLFVKGRDFESKDYTLEFKDGLWHTQNDAVGYSQTTAQREILECLASAPEGLKAREIADTIGKDYNTVKPVLTRLKFRNLVCQPTHGLWALKESDNIYF